MASKKDVLVLFDVDGTLTPARRTISAEVEDFLETKLKPLFTVGLVGGSDLPKIAEQMRCTEDELTLKFDFVFSENGLVAHEKGRLIERQSIADFMGEEKTQKFINFCLSYMSGLTLPTKRGNFIEFRNGLINVCPVGRSCTQEERDQFARFDKENNVREKFRLALVDAFPDLGLHFAIGGQISIDAFPVGWDKRYCLKHVEKNAFKEIHFFGDKTYAGGNDHEIFEDARTIGHTVTSPEDTVKQLKQLFNL